MSRGQARPDAVGPRVAPQGLYAITGDEHDTSQLVRKVGKALVGGARMVQYRSKSADATLRHEQASALLALCRSAQVPFIINDDLDLAETLGADGVHLGRDDIPVSVARTRLTGEKVLGASCYNRLDLAVNAQEAGADYVAFGSAFPSITKPDAVKAPLSLYREAKACLEVPIVAIGGITLENAPLLVRAGADAIALVSALFGADDIELRARKLSALFDIHDLKKRPAV